MCICIVSGYPLVCLLTMEARRRCQIAQTRVTDGCELRIEPRFSARAPSTLMSSRTARAAEKPYLEKKKVVSFDVKLHIAIDTIDVSYELGFIGS